MSNLPVPICKVTLELQPDGAWSADLIEHPSHVGGGTIAYTAEGPGPLEALMSLVKEVYVAMIEDT